VVLFWITRAIFQRAFLLTPMAYTSIVQKVLHDAHQYSHLTEQQTFMSRCLQLGQYTIQQLKLSRSSIKISPAASQSHNSDRTVIDCVYLQGQNINNSDDNRATWASQCQKHSRHPNLQCSHYGYVVCLLKMRNLWKVAHISEMTTTESQKPLARFTKTPKNLVSSS